MEEIMIAWATAGFVAGAALAFVVSANAPGAMPWLRMGSIVALILLPFLLGVSGAQPLIEMASKGSAGQEEFTKGVWASFFALSVPLGALSVSLFKNVGPRMLSLTATGLVGLPMYLIFALAAMGMAMVAHVSEQTGVYS